MLLLDEKHRCPYMKEEHSAIEGFHCERGCVLLPDYRESL